MNVETVIWTMAQAIEIIDKVDSDSDSVGICLDLWNVWQDPDLIDGIKRAGTRILTVQFGDWRTPRSFADRIAPGDGIIPLAHLLDVIQATGYTAPFVLEFFSDDVEDSIFPSRIERSIELARHQLDTF